MRLWPTMDARLEPEVVAKARLESEMCIAAYVQRFRFAKIENRRRYPLQVAGHYERTGHNRLETERESSRLRRRLAPNAMQSAEYNRFAGEWPLELAVVGLGSEAALQRLHRAPASTVDGNHREHINNNTLTEESQWPVDVFVELNARESLERYYNCGY